MAVERRVQTNPNLDLVMAAILAMCLSMRTMTMMVKVKAITSVLATVHPVDAVCLGLTA